MRAILLLSILLATPLATSGSAIAGNHEVTLGSYTRALHADSANAVTDRSLSGGELGYGHRLQLSLIPRLETWVTGGFQWGSTEGSLFQTMTTEIDTLGFTAGGRARYVLHSHLVAHARLDLGTARTALTLRAGDQSVADAGWGATFGAAAGVDLLALAYPTFSLGLRLELGYVTMTAPALSPRESADAAMIVLDGMQASIGHLDLGGRFFSASVIGQF